MLSKHNSNVCNKISPTTTIIIIINRSITGVIHYNNSTELYSIVSTLFNNKLGNIPVLWIIISNLSEIMI